jgi:hypothetical protein
VVVGIGVIGYGSSGPLGYIIGTYSVPGVLGFVITSLLL